MHDKTSTHSSRMRKHYLPATAFAGGNKIESAFRIEQNKRNSKAVNMLVFPWGFLPPSEGLKIVPISIGTVS